MQTVKTFATYRHSVPSYAAALLLMSLAIFGSACSGEASFSLRDGEPTPAETPTPEATPIPSYTLDVVISPPDCATARLDPEPTEGNQYQEETQIFIPLSTSPGCSPPRWSGTDFDNENQARLVMDQDRVVQANFQRLNPDSDTSDVLLDEDFENGLGSEWRQGLGEESDSSSGWVVEPDGSNSVLVGTGFAGLGYEPGREWTDYRLDLKFRSEGAHFFIMFRNGSSGNYGLHFQRGGMNVTRESREGPNSPRPRELLQSNFEMNLGEWHTLAISGLSGRIVAVVDGVKRLDYTDPDPLTQGSFNIEAQQRGLRILFDDLKVTWINEIDLSQVIVAPTATPMPTVPPAPTATPLPAMPTVVPPEPTATAVPTPVSPVSGDVLFQDDFDEKLGDGWNVSGIAFDPSWEIGSDDTGTFLSATGDIHFGYLGGTFWSDYKVSLRTKWMFGGPTFTVREGPAGAHTVWFDTGGGRLLFKGANNAEDIAVNLGTSHPIFDREVWHDIEITAVGNRIVVNVDGVDYIDHVDETGAFPRGSFGMNIGGGGGHTLFDDVLVTVADEDDLPRPSPAPTATPVPPTPTPAPPQPTDGLSLYMNDRQGFIEAVTGMSPLSAISFETLPDSAPIVEGDELQGDEFASLGVVLSVSQPVGASLQICGPSEWYVTNAVSIGNCPQSGAPTGASTFRVMFDSPVSVAGFRVIVADTKVRERVLFVDPSGQVIADSIIEAPGWYGIVSQEENIAEIQILDLGQTGENVLYDNIVWIPAITPPTSPPVATASPTPTAVTSPSTPTPAATGATPTPSTGATSTLTISVPTPIP